MIADPHMPKKVAEGKEEEIGTVWPAISVWHACSGMHP